MSAGTQIRTDVRTRAVQLIKQKFGPLADLPEQLWPVVWVTVYRSCEVSLKVEADGGPNAFLKAALVGGGTSGYEMEMAIRKLELLQNIIPNIRQSKSEIDRKADAQLLTDILKWGMHNAVELSSVRRSIARKFARADSLYAGQVPNEIL